MKTQISRDGYRADKRYSGVYQQQGRMITDRDWNELVDILKTRVDEGFADVVGNGVPRGRAVNLAKDSQGALAIQPGLVYAGGMAGQITPAPGVATPFKYDQQADFPTPPALPAGQAYVLYADLWDRPVPALEDEGLRDPGLNGADTTTRTQAMAQLKWAPTGKDPENAAQNPTRGNATLAASIPTGATGDPLNAVNPVGGDYLFRLEVHDVAWNAGAAPDAPFRLTLKWSRENGAEQHKVLEAPSAFKTGSWVYEVYKLAGEKHLGYHFPSWSPTRGPLFDSFPSLDPQAYQNDFVRRWDGYVNLTRNSTSGTWAAPGTNPSIENGKLILRLSDLELTLDLQGKTFLAGDYWLIPVRRAVHTANTQIVQNALPTGIQHRYVTLANVNATGDVTPKMAPFPALNKIEAGDVRYDGSGCTSGLFTAAQDNVKKALDRLWQLGASHVAYSKASDAHVYSGQTINTAAQALDVLGKLKTEQIAYTAGSSPRGLFSATQDTVKKALDRLGADLAAGHVAYTKESDSNVFSGLTPATVNDALNTLGKLKTEQVAYTAGTSPRGLFSATQDTVKKALDRLGADLAAGHVAYAKESDAPVFTGKTINTVNDALNTLGKVGAGQVSYDRSGYATVKAGLDELFSRPNYTTQDVAVGSGGQYASILIAIQTLAGLGKKDIRIRLLPGNHEIVALPAAVLAQLQGAQVTIVGVRSAAPVKILGQVTFSGLASLRLSEIRLLPEVSQSVNPSLIVQDCEQVTIEDSSIEGLAPLPLVQIQRTLSRIDVRRNQVAAPSSITTESNVGQVFQQLDPAFTQAFGSPSLEAFQAAAQVIFQTLQTLKQQNPTTYNTRLTNARNYTYGVINNQDRTPFFATFDAVDNNNSASYLQNLAIIRARNQVRQPGLALALHDAQANVWLEDNQIYGHVTLYGIPSQPELGRWNLTSLQNQFEFRTDPLLVNTGAELFAARNVVTAFRIGDTMRQKILDLIQNSSTPLTGAFRRITLTDNAIEKGRSQWIANQVHLKSTTFWIPSVSTTTKVQTGWVCGQKVILVGNMSDQMASAVLGVVARQRSETCNLGFTFELMEYEPQN